MDYDNKYKIKGDKGTKGTKNKLKKGIYSSKHIRIQTNIIEQKESSKKK